LIFIIFVVWNKGVIYFMESIHGPIRDIQVYICYPVYCASLFIISRYVNYLRFLTDQLYYLRMHDFDISVKSRYLIFLYILYRLSMKRKMVDLLRMAHTTCTTNFLQFFIFSNKVFYWKDQPLLKKFIGNI